MAEASDSPDSLRILVVRADRIGDVILSTPVFEVIKRHYPRSRLTVMARESVAPLLRGLRAVDDVMIFDPEGRHSGLGGLWRLMQEVRGRDFRIAVVLQSRFRIAAAVFLARVKYRVGPLSKIHSFLFYNRGIRQRRSQVEMHEADYNLQLLRRLGIRAGSRQVPTAASVSPEAREKAKAWLSERGWSPDEPLVAVHPGMGGSALNWPESHYAELVRALLRDGRRVVVTGGPAEGPLLARIGEALGPLKDKAIFYASGSDETVEALGGIFSWAKLVVSPSTGPLHLAVALGRQVVTFFPPVRVQSAIRWGPYQADESRASVLVPEVYCGRDFECAGSLCNYFPCMRSLTVTQALEQANYQLARTEEPKHAQKTSSSDESPEGKESG